jgi:HEAT repeat protein
MPRRFAAFCLLPALCLAASFAFGAEAQLDEPFQKALGFKLGGDSGPLNAVSDLARQSVGKPKERAHVEEQLLAILQSPKATEDAKDFACRQLVVVGTETCVPVLAGLLTDEGMSHMARYALARIEAESAGAALREALGKAKGRPLLGIIGSLGDRQDKKAIPALTKLAGHDDADVAKTAVAALGKIDGEEVLPTIEKASKSGTAEVAAVALDARLRIAANLLDQGKAEQARAIYADVQDSAKAIHVRTAALRGLVLSANDGATMIVKPLLGDDPAMRRAAIGLVREIRGEQATKTFAAQLPKLSPEGKVLLINALTDRGDRAAAPAVLKAAQSDNADVQAAALKALGTLGTADSVPLLAKAAAAEEKTVASAAQSSLRRLSADGVNEAILALLPKSDAKAKAQLVRILADRRADEAVPTLIKLTGDPDEGVRREAFRAIGEMAGADALPSLVSLLLKAEGDSARRAAEKAVVTVADQVEDASQRTEALLAALPKADPEDKVSLLRIVARFGGEKALAATTDALTSDNQQVKDAAVRALSKWPEPTAADALMGIIKSTDNNTHRVLALRGYVRLMALPSNRTAKETLAQCQEVMKLAKSPAEKKLVLSAMANVHHPLALDVLQPYAQNPDLKAEAQAAMKKIKAAMNKPAKATASHNAKKAGSALDGKPKTRWDTGKPQQPGMWFRVEFGLERTFSKVVLDTRGSNGDYPRGYEVYVSRDGENWGQPVAKGEGAKPVTEIDLKPASGRFLKIVQTGETKNLYWSIHEMKVESK